ncbi:MAG: trehalase family glycosidase [Planctomycetota bacterium]
MYWLTSNPWRCWERTTMAGVLNGPDDLLVRVALYDQRTGVYQNEFRWPALDRLGPNDFGGGYAQVTLRFAGVRWSFEMAGTSERTYLLVRCLDQGGSGAAGTAAGAGAPSNATGATEGRRSQPAAASPADIQIRLETLYLRSGGQVVTRENEVVARRAQAAWRISSPTPAAHRTGSTITAPLARPFFAVIEPAAEPGRRLEQRDAGPRVPGRVGDPLTAEERAIAAEIAAARAAFLGRFSYVPREFWWLYAAIPYGLGWNMIWAADRREPIQVCSRDWCVHGNYGEWVLFNWDTFLLIPAAAEYDPAFAHQIVRPQLAVQTPEGLIPGIASPLGVSADRGMPPVASYGLWQAYLRTGDRSFVEPYYERLCRYHAWWRRNRDGNGDGLLEWGSNPTEPAHPQWQAHTLWASRYETGMDNHPMWDGVRFNPETNTQEQTDVGLSSLHALDALCLSKMAAVLGHAEDAARFQSRAATIGRLIDEQLWNEDVGLWLSRDWRGPWNRRASPCCFYPLFLPTAQPARVRRAIDEHLRNPRRFGGQYLLPVLPRDDPAYAEQYYVRGRIWPAQALLVHAALRQAAAPDEQREAAAAELARGCLATMRQEWLEEGHLHENYHAETADGDDTPESDPLYSFGIMLPMVAWQHLRDRRLDGTEVTADLAQFEAHLDPTGSLRQRSDPAERMPGLE